MVNFSYTWVVYMVEMKKTKQAKDQDSSRQGFEVTIWIHFNLYFKIYLITKGKKKEEKRKHYPKNTN